MLIGDLIDRSSIVQRASATSKRKALSAIAETVARNLDLDADDVLEALLAREEGGSTGVGYGVAVPHAHIEGLDRMRGVFVRLEHPVDFDAVDGQPVDLMFALLAPKGAGAEHLRALARVSRLLRKAELREQLRHARTADAIHALLAHGDVLVAAPSAA